MGMCGQNITLTQYFQLKSPHSIRCLSYQEIILSTKHQNISILKVDCQKLVHAQQSLSRNSKKFIDQAFIPSKDSLGDLELEYNPPWKLAGTLVQSKNLQILNGPLPVIELALKSRSQFYQSLFRGKEQGAWFLRLCKNKAICEFAIDEFIPADLWNQSLIVQSNDIRFLLLMKGLAKLMNSYENMVKSDLKDIITCLFYCPTLSITPKFYQTKIIHHYRNGALILALSHDLTIQENGLLPNQLYLLTHVQEYPEWKQGPIFKFCSCSKEYQWKGRLSRRAKFWDEIGVGTRQSLSSYRTKGNQFGSFYMTLQELQQCYDRIFVCLTYSQIPNIDFLHLKSQEQGIIQVNFKLPYDSTVDLSFGLNQLESVPETLLVMAQVKENSIQSIPLLYSRMGNQKIISCQAKSGQYLIFAKVDSTTSSDVVLQVSSSKPAFLRDKSTGLKIEKWASHFARKRMDASNGKTAIGSNPEDWIAKKQLFNELGLGFIIIYLSKGSSKKVRLSYKTKSIQEEGFRILNKDEEQISTIISSGMEMILIFGILPTFLTKTISFPPPVTIDQHI